MFVRLRDERGGRPTVLLVHGLGESGLCFEAFGLRPELSELQLLVPDLPGYGRSAWPPSPLSLAETAERLAGWILRRGEGRVVVAGHSMGGVVAQLLARAHPDLLAGLIDIDGNLTLDDCSFSGKAAGETLADFLDRGFDELRDDVYATGVHNAAHRGYSASLRLADPLTFHRHSLELVELSRAETLSGELARVDVPVLYIAGVPGGASARSRELLDREGVPWRAIGPSGHWPFIDRPADVAREITAFAGALTPR
jgi:pimeloyl-ACP methyl ester carboxylesterase